MTEVFRICSCCLQDVLKEDVTRPGDTWIFKHSKIFYKREEQQTLLIHPLVEHSVPTKMGHLNQERKNLRTTKQTQQPKEQF